MTIGRPQGAVWIGKPLDVVIPLALDDAEAGGALCLEAEVMQGDNPMSNDSLRVSLEPGTTPSNSRIRIRSNQSVDEPVINVSVRAGCEMRSSRSYVLLADVPTQASLPLVARTETPPPSVRIPEGASNSRGSEAGSSSGFGSSAPARRQSAAPAARSEDADAPPPRRAAAPAAAPRRPAAAPPPVAAAPRSVTPRAPAPAPAAEAPRREARVGGARLQLESLEPVPVAQPGLKTTNQLTMPAVEDPARRAAAAADWRALSGDPEAAQRDAQRESERIKSLEATLATLREQTAQNQRALLELRSELADARESRYSNPLVYALIGLLLLALVAILLLWRLAARRAEPAWWREPSAKADEGPTRPDTFDKMVDEDLAEQSSRRDSANATNFGTTTFAGLVPDAEEAEPEPPPARTPDGVPVRPVNTEELFDVQQQSDFFLSLGQHDQAIAVLREHIATNPGTSALAYLDLLRIYHALDRQDDYARLSEEFEHAFNADVPDFDQFNQTGKGLEHYRGALARIESQWPAPGTLALIEELIFRKPGTHEDEVFDLAAYQELLLLYSVAKEVIDPDSAPPAPVTAQSFADTYSHDAMLTAPAPFEPESPPDAIDAGPTLPPSMYGAIDDHLGHETVLVPEAPAPAPDVPDRDSVRVQPDVSLDLEDFDRTAFETMRAPIDSPKPPPAPSTDPHVIDFELFDPDTEAEIAPKPIKKR
ncbi:bZIP transcription factor [Variovorax sp. KK3]|uniref:bZIP transcription factor n=1 Tax=Variovorax sp. KK3 TaxID=1855728 RepID=UPI00117C2192|nr:bZIP transcription factor [Variovorax sp. KK3]